MLRFLKKLYTKNIYYMTSIMHNSRLRRTNLWWKKSELSHWQNQELAERLTGGPQNNFPGLVNCPVSQNLFKLRRAMHYQISKYSQSMHFLFVNFTSKKKDNKYST